MDYAEGSRMRRSTSMPVKPRPLEVKELKRSEEKETVYKDIDYYPESPKLQRKFPHGTDEDPFTNNWTGSTIELDTDIRRMEMNDTPTSRKKSYRVIEKSGRENVIFRRIPEKSWRYIRDFVTTLVRSLLSFWPRVCIKPAASNVATVGNGASSGGGDDEKRTKNNDYDDDDDERNAQEIVEESKDNSNDIRKNEKGNRGDGSGSGNSNSNSHERVTFSLS